MRFSEYSPGRIKKKRSLRQSLLFRVAFFCFMVSPLLFTLRFAYSREDRDSSRHLYEYALERYKHGNIADAVHELNKALMVNPNNCAAKKLLRKIFPQRQLLMLRERRASLNSCELVCPGEKIIFDAGITDMYGWNTNFFYIWDFGDGVVTEGGPYISHSYRNGGKYTVTVVIDILPRSKCPIYIKQCQIKVNSPPQAVIGPNMACCVDTYSHFDGSGSIDPDGERLSYLWDFGDGSFGEGVRARHSYSNIGKYRVRLEVRDSCSASTGSVEVDITDQPVAIINIK